MQYTEKELKQNRFHFCHSDFNEITIEFPEWTGRCRNRIRVWITNSKLKTARPGLGGTFKLSYDYGPSFPVKGTGFAKVKNAMLNSHGGWIGQFYKTDERYGNMVASAIVTAKKMIEKEIKSR